MLYITGHYPTGGYPTGHPPLEGCCRGVYLRRIYPTGGISSEDHFATLSSVLRFIKDLGLYIVEVRHKSAAF